MSSLPVRSKPLVESLLSARHLAAVALDAPLHGTVTVQDRQRSAQRFQPSTLQQFHLHYLLLSALYPLKLLVIIGSRIFVQQDALLLYIAEGCMNIPFLLECKRFTLGIKFVFCSSSALIKCGNITNKKRSLIFKLLLLGKQIIYSLYWLLHKSASLCSLVVLQTLI